MKKHVPKNMHRFAGSYLCVGCGLDVRAADGLFIYHRPEADNSGWGGYISHLNPTCICKTFVHYIHTNGFDPVETMIALDAATREHRDEQAEDRAGK